MRRAKASHLLFRTFLLAALAIVCQAVSLAQTEQKAPAIEQGKFRLHKFEQRIGEETYEVTADGDSLAVAINFKFTDRGSAVPLTVNFHAAKDLTPQSFEIKGKTSRFFFQAEDGIRDYKVTGVQTCALPI